MEPIDPKDLVRGWVQTPNVRGSLDILYSSLATIYLCTWTSLCLNVPRPYQHHWRFLLYKLRWQLFAIFFPEVLVAVTAEQWLSAKQSVGLFSKIGHPEWTIRHGFFADMGCIKVAPPDIVPFPVNAQQLAYLVENKYLAMPEIKLREIEDVNKLDELARAITLVQMGYFTVQSIARGVQSLSLCPLELTTLAFILCTLHTFYFWYHKPLDPYEARVFPMSTPISQVVRDADASEEYTRTPLDFILPRIDPRDLTAAFWWGCHATLNFGRAQLPKPAQTFANSRPAPPHGQPWSLTVYLLMFQLIYYGLHIGAGWNMSFPTHAESLLWMIANFVEFGLIAFYVVNLPVGNNYHFVNFAARVAFGKDAKEVFSILEVCYNIPLWAQWFTAAWFVYGYAIARLYVLTESCICLRALPAVLYQDVDWTNFLPHI